MRLYPRGRRVSIRVGNVLPDVSGEIRVPDHDATRSVDVGEPAGDRFAVGTEPLGIRCVADVEIERIPS